MRFEQLSVPAYGPFTGLDLDLPAGGSDFHLIYGPNEAGKSSLLRAIRDLLYGIHGQTTDNFRHAYKDLRIAGRIAASDGRRLRFQRRKGNKDTLLDADGLALPDDARRNEAEAVAQAEELRRQLREAERAQTDAEARLNARDADHADWRVRWAAAWGC